MSEEKYIVEEFELSDDESDVGDHEYLGVEDDDDVSSDEAEDLGLETTMRSIRRETKEEDANLDEARKEEEDTPLQVTADVKPSVIDDFIRNFLIRAGMSETLDVFNREWYQLKSEKQVCEEDVPDIYLMNQNLQRDVRELRREAEDAKKIAAKAQGTWNKFRKERDFHRMHHKRVMQEKERLIVDIKRLKKHYATFEPALKALRKKYETAMKDKMLLRLERDRLRAKCGEEVTSTTRRSTRKESASKSRTITSKRSKMSKSNRSESRKTRCAKDATLPGDAAVVNPYHKLEFDEPEASTFEMRNTFKGHVSPISALAFHTKKSLLATASDDATWKLWSLPSGELIMCGEGHRDWISDVAFSPTIATQLVTASGDGDVKLWDFKSARCAHTFSDHAQAVWGASYHHGGEFFATCSMDQTSKLWDIRSMRCRQTFRGHVDSVNAIQFQPFANNVCTASGDKTVSMWDIRSGLCVQTFYGHENSCNDVSFALSGDTVASSDADGVVRLWDVRTVSQIAKIDAGPHPVNSIDFDRSGKTICLASDDGTVKIYGNLLAEDGPSLIKTLKGHEDAVQAVLFDPIGKYVVSGSSDCTFRVWS